MKKRYYQSNELKAVTGTPIVGWKYHVSWGTSRGVVGVCVSVDEAAKTVVIKSPSTGIHWKYPVKWSELRHIRKNENKILTKDG